ncbi:MAG: VacB/RNase II family 3'-5' exoribonuclease [Acidobacteriota bacterium]|nr:VacB/RNase II family 3'-5' exoribonuclease [Acidobacteriota bacterium]
MISFFPIIAYALQPMSRKKQINQTAATIDTDELLAAIRREPDGLTIVELAELFELSRAEQKSVSLLLSQLQGCGLLRRQGQEFRWADSNRALLGTIRQRRRKTINFIPDDAHERARGRIRIAAEDLNGAYDGDRVVVSLVRAGKTNEREAKGDREARVEMILRRGQLRIIGRLHHGFRESWVESLDEKFLFDIEIGGGEAAELEDGWIVLVEITGYPSGSMKRSGVHHRQNPKGRIIEKLGASSSEPGMDINVVIFKHDLPHVFPPEVLAEAESHSPVVTEDQLVGRLDLREVPTVTIDGETARDFDDAISLKKLSNGNFQLGVHIADVSYYVRTGTLLDVEARLRGTSVYFPERAIPMLPEHLSNGICSLNPKVDRLTMSALMEVDKQGRVVNYELRESVICSNERMTYTDVNKLLTHADPQLAMKYADLLDLFKTMEELARILIRMRTQRGAIDFNLPESVFEFDDEGRVAGVLKADRNIAHRIIEEFMLLANETVASHFHRLGVPAMYRIHEEPEVQRVIEFAQLATTYGYRFPMGEISSKNYQQLSKQLEGKPEERVLAYAMLRSLQRAKYSAQNVGHFGLAAPIYTHFTSPIRRYPDLIVHRVLRALLKEGDRYGTGSGSDRASLKEGDRYGTGSGSDRASSEQTFSRGNRGATASRSVPKNAPKPIPFGELELMAQESSDRERAADAAENEIDEWRKAVFMAERLGEEFDGMITNVRDFGFYVELDEFFIEGLVPVASLIDDYYNFDERSHSLTARSGRRKFRIGDRIRVRVDRVNVDRHLVDFSVVDSSQPRSGKKRR